MIKVDITGFVGKDAVKENFAGRDTWKFTLAVNRPQKNGEDQPPNWFTCNVDSGPRADKLMAYIKKGKQLNVTGRMQVRPAKTAGQDPWIDVYAPVDLIQFVGTAIDKKEAARADAKQDENTAPLDF